MCPVGLKHLGVAFFGGRFQQVAQRNVEVSQDKESRQKGCKQQKCRLQGIRPNHRLDTAFEGVEQNNGYEDDRWHPKWNAPVLEDELI